MSYVLRMAFGSGRCEDGLNSSDIRVRDLCGRILTRLENLKRMRYEVLVERPDRHDRIESIEGREAVISTYKHELESQEVLFVVQGFLPSWRKPNYIYFWGVGHNYAEGLVVSKSGEFKEAPDDLLWGFR